MQITTLTFMQITILTFIELNIPARKYERADKEIHARQIATPSLLEEHSKQRQKLPLHRVTACRWKEKQLVKFTR